MDQNSNNTSPLQRAWNWFSAMAGVVGTAGMVDDIANWVSLIRQVVQGYQVIIHPLLAPIAELLKLPSWFADYLFVGAMVSGARARPTFNHMKGHWLFDISGYKWYAFWAPHRFAGFFLSVIMAFVWPLLLILFIPPQDKSNKFQQAIWRDQLQWLAVYGLTLLGLFIANAGLRALSAASIS